MIELLLSLDHIPHDKQQTLTGKCLLIALSKYCEYQEFHSKQRGLVNGLLEVHLTDNIAHNNQNTGNLKTYIFQSWGLQATDRLRYCLHPGCIVIVVDPKITRTTSRVIPGNRIITIHHIQGRFIGFLSNNQQALDHPSDSWQSAVEWIDAQEGRFVLQELRQNLSLAQIIRQLYELRKDESMIGLSRNYVSAVVKRNFRHVYRSRNYYFFSLRLYVSLDEWISGRESVDVIDEENQHSRLSLSHYLEEKSRRSLVEELCSAYELSTTSVDLLPSLYKRIEREEQTAAMTSLMKVEKEGNISRYYYLADIEATSVHHSYQQHIRLFTWTKMTSLRWVLPRRTTATTTPARDTTSAEREGLEFLDFSTLTSLLQENNLDKLYGRKVMYLSLQRALFCSDDFHERPFPMFFNIEAIATSVQRSVGGGGSASGGCWEYVFKPAYFHFADVSQSTSLDELIAVLSKYQSDISDKEVIRALTDARVDQRERNDVTTGVKRSARASSSAFQSQLTHRVHMSYQEFHQQQSQLSSQMILYSISPLRERDLAKPANLLPPLPLPRTEREEEEEREARLILPVIAYDVALAELFQGITANLIALAIYRKQQQQEEEKSTSLPPSLPYDDICYDAINTLQQTSESEHNYLVIVRFIQSCDDEEAMTCTNIDEMFAESYPSDVTPSHSTHPQQSSVIAILERLVL